MKENSEKYNTISLFYRAKTSLITLFLNSVSQLVSLLAIAKENTEKSLVSSRWCHLYLWSYL